MLGSESIGGGVMVQRTRRATYQDIMDAPDNMIAELIDGDLLLSPRPRAPHQLAATRLCGLLFSFLDGGISRPGGWIFYTEVELHFDERETVLVPDIAGWRQERLPGPIDVQGIELPPDWVCEVLSPSTERIDRHRKMQVYAAHEVAWLWLLDPIGRTVEIHRREPEGYLFLGVFSGDVVMSAPPFGVPINLALLWGNMLAGPPAAP